MATAHRYVTEVIDLLAEVAPDLRRPLRIARRKACVVPDGTLAPSHSRLHPRGDRLERPENRRGRGARQAAHRQRAGHRDRHRRAYPHLLQAQASHQEGRCRSLSPHRASRHAHTRKGYRAPPRR
ncbi:hypothetical protein [Actinomadura darangshiensis]|uniref:hypothetical protein n=1 Tax=Actinomadura darangshiensis TaxID=705336 RepID=UPI003C7D1DD6